MSVNELMETWKETGSGGGEIAPEMLWTVGQSACGVGIAEHTRGSTGSSNFLELAMWKGYSSVLVTRYLEGI
jgi:hypothetical protein